MLGFDRNRTISYLGKLDHDPDLRQDRETRVFPWSASPFTGLPATKATVHAHPESQVGVAEKPLILPGIHDGSLGKSPTKAHEFPQGPRGSLDVSALKETIGILVDAAWVNGFEDLAFVSALGAYNEVNEINTGSDIAAYAAFFVIVWWIWSQQTFYDVRFEVSDLFHRIVRFAEFMVFVVMGTYGSTFDVRYGLDEEDFRGEQYLDPAMFPSRGDPGNLTGGDFEALTQAADNDNRRRSWRVIILLYVLSRGLLATQWIQLLFYAQRSHRITKSIFVPLVSILTSLILWSISLSLMYKSTLTVSSQRLKLVLCYLGISIEMVGCFVETRTGGFSEEVGQSFRGTNLGERFALLTLVIMGEGVISMVVGTQKAVTTYGFSAETNVAIFCGLFLVYLIFHLYFDGMGKTLRTGRLRSVGWCWVHLPLHFCIILIFASLRGLLVYTNLDYGSAPLLTSLSEAYDQIWNQTYSLNTTHSISLSTDLARVGFNWPRLAGILQDRVEDVVNAGGSLPGVPEANVTSGDDDTEENERRWFNFDFDQDAHEILGNVKLESDGLTEDSEIVDSGAEGVGRPFLFRRDEPSPLLQRAPAVDGNETDQIARRNLTLAANGILVDVVFKLWQRYGVATSGSPVDLYKSLVTNDTLLADSSNLDHLVSLLMRRTLGPSLYAAPSAGLFLILSTIANSILRWPRDFYGYVGLSIRFGAGFFLCMLGFLGLGNHKVTVSRGHLVYGVPVYRMAQLDALISTIAAVLLVVAALEYVTLLYARSAYRSYDLKRVDDGHGLDPAPDLGVRQDHNGEKSPTFSRLTTHPTPGALKSQPSNGSGATAGGMSSSSGVAFASESSHDPMLLSPTSQHPGTRIMNPYHLKQGESPGSSRGETYP